MIPRNAASVAIAVFALTGLTAEAADCDRLSGQARVDCTNARTSAPDIHSKEDAPGQPQVGPATPRTPGKRVRTAPPSAPPQDSPGTAPGQPPAPQPVTKTGGKPPRSNAKAQAAPPTAFGPESGPGQSPQTPPGSPPVKAP